LAFHVLDLPTWARDARAAGGGRSTAYLLGWGDLLVMGGASQRTWQHAIEVGVDGGQNGLLSAG
jgi:alkylated DNA repair dioxygenase AlkB